MIKESFKDVVYFKELTMLREMELKVTERLIKAYESAIKAQEEIKESEIDLSAIRERIEECEEKLVNASQEVNCE